jgi:myo-inositol-1(or 4)-monophosphatase
VIVERRQIRDPASLREISMAAALEAATLIRSRLGTARVLRSKSSPTDAVTQTDLDAEHLIRGLLVEATPEAGIFGEEGGGTRPGADLQWVIDPLDGTINFLYGLPVVAVSIAAVQEGVVVAGAVVDVLQREVFSAAVDRGARLDEAPIHVVERRAISQSLVTTGFSYQAAARQRQGQILGRLLAEARDVRCFGSCALQLCWVAAGRTDAHFERHTQLWDHAAGALVAKEAGATTELPCPENDDLIIAATPGIFLQLASLVDESAELPAAES